MELHTISYIRTAVRMLRYTPFYVLKVNVFVYHDYIAHTSQLAFVESLTMMAHKLEFR